MANSTDIDKINLALSGGGFRATLFHLGALWRLNELGALPRLRRVASVSGGAITAAYLGLRWPELSFRNGVASNFQHLVVKPLRRFCAKNVDAWAIARVLPRPWQWRSAGNVLDGAYRRGLFGRASLQDLPDYPRFIFLSSNVLTGAMFRFSKAYAGDYRYGMIAAPEYRLSQAVAASSSFPPVLSPFGLKVDPSQFERSIVEDESWHLHRTLYLSDGGVIDNLGLDMVFRQPGNLFVSDASAPPRFEPGMLPLWITLTKRTVDIASYQALPLRRRLLIDQFSKGVKTGTYWGIRSEIMDYQLDDCLDCPVAVTGKLAGIRTRLNHFSEEEQCRLINWGYAICDAAVRRHVLTDRLRALPAWPYPEYSLSKP